MEPENKLSLRDLPFNLRYIDCLNAKSKEEVLAASIDAIETLADVIDAISFDGAYALPWAVNCGKNEDDETEDVKVYSNDRKDVICTDSGWYPPNCANSKIIVQCVNAIWNLKNKLIKGKETR